MGHRKNWGANGKQSFPRTRVRHLRERGSCCLVVGNMNEKQLAMTAAEFGPYLDQHLSNPSRSCTLEKADAQGSFQECERDEVVAAVVARSGAVKVRIGFVDYRALTIGKTEIVIP